MSWDNDNNPWGNNNSGGNKKSGGGGNFDPDKEMERMVREGQEKIKQILPNGMGNSGLILVALVLVALWLASGLYKVNPGQKGVELVFGSHSETTDEGLHYNFPRPIGQTIIPEVSQIRRIDIGRRVEQYRGQELQSDNLGESLMLTGDENIVDLNLTVFWRIAQAEDFLFNVRDVEKTIKIASESVMRDVVGQRTFDEVVTTGRQQIELRARSSLQELLDSYNAGVTVENVALQKSDPPKDVIEAFNDVQRARQDRERLQNEAQAYANSIVPEARGQADQMVRDAEAYRERLVKEAKGEADRFTSVYQAYSRYPEVTKRRMYLETVGKVLKDSDKIIMDSKTGGVLPYLSVDKLNGNRATTKTKAQ